ncbi:MAG TPA: guanylate kinase [Miltoncostaeaceae bacterium]|nr:guanylate kinase [Miltoncostaeaceae bacterium]
MTVARRPRVIVVSGPSGAGKGTLIQEVRARIPGLAVAISATTRGQRPGERDGREYHFLTPDEFDRRVAAGEFLEWVTYAGRRYGTLRSEVERILAAGASVILEIELRGARAVREALPDCVAVFIRPPRLEDLHERLTERGTESADEVAARLAESAVEMRAEGEFDHVVVNDEVARAAEELTRIVDDATRVHEASHG